MYNVGGFGTDALNSIVGVMNNTQPSTHPKLNVLLDESNWIVPYFWFSDLNTIILIYVLICTHRRLLIKLAFTMCIYKRKTNNEFYWRWNSIGSYISIMCMESRDTWVPTRLRWPLFPCLEYFFISLLYKYFKHLLYNIQYTHHI